MTTVIGGGGGTAGAEQETVAPLGQRGRWQRVAIWDRF